MWGHSNAFRYSQFQKLFCWEVHTCRCFIQCGYLFSFPVGMRSPWRGGEVVCVRLLTVAAKKQVVATTLPPQWEDGCRWSWLSPKPWVEAGAVALGGELWAPLAPRSRPRTRGGLAGRYLATVAWRPLGRQGGGTITWFVYTYITTQPRMAANWGGGTGRGVFPVALFFHLIHIQLLRYWGFLFTHEKRDAFHSLICCKPLK